MPGMCQAHGRRLCCEPDLSLRALLCWSSMQGLALAQKLRGVNRTPHATSPAASEHPPLRLLQHHLSSRQLTGRRTAARRPL